MTGLLGSHSPVVHADVQALLDLEHVLIEEVAVGDGPRLLVQCALNEPVKRD
jgi:hypothetical protein